VAFLIDTLLFDLDGTLVHFGYDEFLQAYLQAIGAKVASFVDPKKFVKQLLASTTAMLNSLDPSRSNEEVFWDHFRQSIDLDVDKLLPVLDDFYVRDFPKLQQILKPTPLPQARSLVAGLLAEGYQVVIATNPVFPRVAIEERLRWGNLHDLPYTLVTTYENSTYCKPHVEYYQEILKKVDRSPRQCMMIGNNTCEDLVAADLGIVTYLVEDCLLDDGPFYRTPHFRGTFRDLVAFVESRQFAKLGL